MNVLKVVIISVLFSIRAGFSEFRDSSFLRYADSLFQCTDTSQQTFLKIFKEGQTFYQLTTCKTLSQPYEKVVTALQDIPSYKKYFKFMKNSRFLYDSNPMDTVALFEPGVLYYRAYYFGKISEEFNNDSTRCTLYCGNADQKRYKKEWSKQIGGLIKIGFNEMDIYWRLQRLANNKTRISLTTSQSPKIWIPQWLMEIASKNIFPGMLRELVTYLQCN